MKPESSSSDWTPDKKISWGSSLLVVVLTNFLLLFLESIGIFDLGRNAFWLGTAAGCFLAVALNWLRPRYEQAGRFWGPIYRFMVEQVSPPE
jgi:hypothetical protein